MLTHIRALKSAPFLFALLLAAACGAPSDTTKETAEPSPSTEAAEVSKGSIEHIRDATGAVDDAALLQADANPGDWLSYGRNHSEDRYSPLNQINPDNLSDLGLAWTLELTSTRGVQATPIVVDGIMYFTGPWSVVYAVDARKGEILWTFDPDVPREKAAHMCCGVVNRGVALYKGSVFVGTMDGRLISLEAATGAAQWSVMTVPEGGNYSITGAPRIANGKVLIGNGGAELANVRGFVTAYDAATGEQAWRFYTVPGDPSKPFENPILEEAAKTWTGNWWKNGGGGTAWDAIVYDPEFNSVYIGVGNGTHWDQAFRSPEGGDNLFLSSIVAVDADTGAYKWHYQTTPGDTWDYTATQPIILAELEIDGQQRQVLMQAPKNGFFYVIDRTNGELISAKPFSYVNWATGIGEDGRPIEVEGARYLDGRTHWISPSSHGAHNWFPMSFHHETGLVFIPGVIQSGPYARNTDMPNVEDGIIQGNELAVSIALRSFNEQVIDPKAAPPGVATGELIAYDPIAQKRVWNIPQPAHYNGGLLSTTTGLLMQGDAEGKFSIRDVATGDVLWDFDVRSGVISAPVTYTVDGEQYITIIAEWGGGQGQVFRLTDAEYPGTVYTFKLGGTAAAPDKLPTNRPPLTQQTTNATTEEIGWGYTHYFQNCFGCHGVVGKGGGAIPNLARLSDETYESFDDIIRLGAFAESGMPIHDHLTAEDVANIRSYVFFVADALNNGKSQLEIGQTVAAYQKAIFETAPTGYRTIAVEQVAKAEDQPTDTPETGAYTGDPAKGKRAAGICVSCHTFTKDGASISGPNLWDILGRDIASVEGYRYSKALTEMEGNWTSESLDAFLKAPRKFAPGTTMSIAVPQDKRRADILAYLETLTD